MGRSVLVLARCLLSRSVWFLANPASGSVRSCWVRVFFPSLIFLVHGINFGWLYPKKPLKGQTRMALSRLHTSAKAADDIILNFL